MVWYSLQREGHLDWVSESDWFPVSMFVVDNSSSRGLLSPVFISTSLNVDESVLDQKDGLVFNPFPNDMVDVVVGVVFTAVVVLSIARVASPLTAGAFVAVPGSLPATFGTGVAISNFLQSAF